MKLFNQRFSFRSFFLEDSASQATVATTSGTKKEVKFSDVSDVREFTDQILSKATSARDSDTLQTQLEEVNNNEITLNDNDKVVIAQIFAGEPTSLKTYLKFIANDVFRTAMHEMKVVPPEVFAAFVLCNQETAAYDIICIASGCNNERKASKLYHHHVRSLPRFSVTDCRAEVVARRCFQYFLYAQLYDIMAYGSSE